MKNIYLLFQKNDRSKKAITLFALIFFFSLTAFAQQNYYWVGGSGSWNDINHWATTSGGAVKHDVVPNIHDNVFFDANSSNSNFGISLGADIYCHNMTWDIPVVGSLFGGSLHISGNLILQAEINTRVNNIYWESDESVSWRLNGATLDPIGRIQISGAGDFTIEDNIVLSDNTNSVKYSGSGSLTIKGFFNGSRSIFSHKGTGSVIFEKDIKIGTIGISRGEATAKDLNIESSVFIDGDDAFVDISGSVINGSWSCSSSHLLDENSHIIATEFAGLSTHVYNKVTFRSSKSRIYNPSGSVSSGHQFKELTIMPGALLLLPEGQTLTITQSLTASSLECSEFIELKSQKRGVQAILNIVPGAVVDINGVLIQDIKATGNVPVTATNSYDKGNNIGFNIISLSPQTYYWVGGSGNWDDKAHWATTSGGASGICVPTLVDDVVFDVNSGFTTTSNTVTLDNINNYCHNMTWDNAPNNPKLECATNYEFLNIFGSVVLQNGMIYQVGNTVWTSDDTETWQFNGAVPGSMDVHFNVYGAGDFIIEDDVSFPDKMHLAYRGGGSLTVKGIFDGDSFTNAGIGTVTFEKDIETFTLFPAEGSTIARNINIIVSDVSNSSLFNSDAVFDVRGSTITTNGWAIGSEHVYLDNSHIKLVGDNTRFSGEGAQNYNKVTFESSGSTGLSDDLHIRELTVMPGVVLKLGKNKTVFISQSFKASGPGCAGLIELKSDQPGNQAEINFESGAMVEIRGVLLQDIKAIGNTPVVAISSFDGGNNTGFDIKKTTSQTYYWIGGSGNWNDIAHWASTSGGIGGVCVPKALDNVVFDANSGFTTQSNTVTLDGENHYCNNMTWQDAPNNPLLWGSSDPNKNLIISGNVTLQNEMIYRVYNTIWKSDDAVSWYSNNVLHQSRFYIRGSGAFTVEDRFEVCYDEDDDDPPMELVIYEGSGSLLFKGAFKSPNAFVQSGTGTSTFKKQVDIGVYDDNCSPPTYGDDMFRIESGMLNAKNININAGRFASWASANIDITGSTINVSDWYSDAGVLQAGNSHITIYSYSGETTTFRGLSTHAYNEVFFKSFGSIEDNSHQFEELILLSGEQLTVPSGQTQTVNKNFYSSGTPCNRSELKSSIPGTQANIVVLAGRTNYDYAVVQDINATGSYQPWNFEMHSQNNGNNTFMDFEPIGTNPIEGLGEDISNPAFPHTITTDGFYPSPQTSFLWNDGSTGTELVVNKFGTYKVTATYADGCEIEDELRLKLEAPQIDCIREGETVISGTGYSGAVVSVAIVDNATTATATVKIDNTWAINTIALSKGQAIVANQTAYGETSSETTTRVIGSEDLIVPTATVIPPSNSTAIDGGIDVDEQQGHEYSIDGINWATTGDFNNLAVDTYTVTARLTNSPNCISEAVFYVRNCGTISGITTVCVGETTQLTASSSGGTWTTTNSSVAEVDNTGLVMGVAEGTAVISYKLGGCTATETVMVNKAIETNYMLSDPLVCLGKSVTITLSGSELGVNYQLQKGTLPVDVGNPVTGTGNAIHFVVSPTNDTSYKVLATSADNLCSQEISDPAIVRVVTRLISDYTVTSTTSVCKGMSASIQLTNSQSGVQYQLQTLDGTNVGTLLVSTSGPISLGTGAIVTNTTFQIEASIPHSTTSDCTTILDQTVTISVDPLPSFTVMTSDVTCFDAMPADGWLEVTTTSNDGPFTIELFKNGALVVPNGTVTNITDKHTFNGLDEGLYHVKVTNNSGCSESNADNQ